MAKKQNEYDYLYLSARIHAMENKLLTRERMERMLSARSAEEASKVLAECGYGDFPSLTPAAIDLHDVENGSSRYVLVKNEGE